MIEITDYAYKILLGTLSNNLHKSSEYGSPPIFYWYRNMIEETRKIEMCRYLSRGEFQYKLGYYLGVAYVTCQYVGRKRFLIVTNYDINNRVLFSWRKNSDNGDKNPKSKLTKPRKEYRILTKRPLFGYSFVMNDRGEYNLLDSNDELLTQWFRAIRPINQPQPYGKYQIIAYIDVGGYFCALGYDGQVYNLNKTWKEMCSENRNILKTELLMNIITENIDNTMKNKKVIRLTESDLHRIINESVKKVLTEEFDRAAFENACDYLYYGYGFNKWRKAHDYLDPVSADEIWNAAFRKVSEDPTADFIPHSIESYDDMMSRNDKKMKVQPDENGRYPHENMNILDSDGLNSLYAQGGSRDGENHRIDGVRAIKYGGMSLGDAMREYEKNYKTINYSTDAQRAFDQGRIGNKHPLHRNGSLNRAIPKKK